MYRLEALAWLDQRCDAVGECDRCHAQDKPLWALPQALDREPDAGWLYCAACFRKIVNSRFGKPKLAHDDPGYLSGGNYQ